MTNPEQKIHEKFVEYGSCAKVWTRRCVLLLPEIDRLRIWEKKGFASIYEYAAKLAGMNRNTVDDALRILRKVEGKPALQKVIEEKGINAVRPVVTIATKKDEIFWANKAKIMSKNTLETYVREFRTSTSKNTYRKSDNSHEKQTVILQLDPDIAAKLLNISNINSVLREFLDFHENKLNKEKPLGVNTNSRHIPSKIKKFIIKRCNNKCEYQGCTKDFCILHHTLRFSLTNKHDPDYIFALCYSHERLFHLGLVKNEEKGPEYWQIQEYPDIDHPKFEIDNYVTKLRMAKTASTSGFP